MKNHCDLSSHLLDGQWGGFRCRPDFGDLAAKASLLLLVLDDSGVVHHGQVWGQAAMHANEDVLGGRESGRTLIK